MYQIPHSADTRGTDKERRLGTTQRVTSFSITANPRSEFVDRYENSNESRS